MSACVVLRLETEEMSCLMVLLLRRRGWTVIGEGGSGSLTGGGRARDVVMLSKGLVHVDVLCHCVAAGVRFS